jgi:3-hydroxyisobutyrate dehydrogenase-like beta-hydroxyacid dehydrogenase
MELGIIGLGQMGSRMAVRLLGAGHVLTVLDPNDGAVTPLVARGAKRAGSPRAVAEAAGIVLLSLPTPDIVHRVALGEGGLCEAGRAAIVVDTSTTGPRKTVEIAEAIGRSNPMRFVDCPVSGGVAGAEKGTLAMMLSCPAEILGQIQPILAQLGQVFHVGERPGLGQTLKLANNLLAAAALAISSEAMVMGVKAGLDPQTMIDVISASSGRNSAIGDKFPRAILPRSFDFGFSTGLSFKDVRLCVDEAEAMGIPMIIGSAVRQMLAMTNSTFGPDSDCTEMVKLAEAWAGVQVDGRKPKS